MSNIPDKIQQRSSTMEDVAQRAGVSKVAVSVVLHNTRTNTRVSPATRQRIVQAAQDLKYTPNGVARALRRRRMNVVGLYLGDWLTSTHDVFLAEIVSGLQAGCDAHHKDLLIHSTFRGQSVDDISAELVNGKIDGLVMFARREDPLVSRLASSSVPVIAVADAVPNLPSVVVDDRGGSALIARYLAEKGHQRILYRQGPHAQESVQRRYLGFCEAAAGFGMEVVADPAPDPLRGTTFLRSPSEWEWDCLTAPAATRPTAIVCCTDRMAYPMVSFCQQIGLRVPDDIAIVGFDGFLQEFPPAVRLTTIRAPWSEAARIAFDLVVEALDGKMPPPETVLSVEFVPGETA